ncbi:NAD-dependent epimerase/dehydratase family protein [Streptomyces liangshanensis]|uniref:Epimerase n=1 Tax=Streptomyces liangshanensis TaxID=2717324 RepID=A0A6G9GVD5_9ACTN|nr:NAD-dependent epimerase/dehydratase family protein [Streptomyces liangshanensis]QIQ02185.1 epimerase [Streptomyces liangshanensis]
MKVIIFGATGMVGQGVLRECLLDPEVERVLLVSRTPTTERHGKIREIIPHDFHDFTPIEAELDGYDACFFTLGITSVGKSEADYRRVTYDITLAAARVLSARNPDLTFVYVSGTGTDNTERGRVMWARVKGATENALLALPFSAYMFHPGVVYSVHGEKSKTRWYRVVHTLTAPLSPLLLRLLPRLLVTTEQVGRAMLTVARQGWPERFLSNRDLITAAGLPRGVSGPGEGAL